MEDEVGKVWNRLRRNDTVKSRYIPRDMRVNCRRVAFLILVSYFVISCYTGFLLIQRRRALATHENQRIQALTEVSDDNGNPGRQGEQLQYRHQYPRILWNLEDDQGLVPMGNHTKPEFVVEIWGKAAISLYLWQHIFDADLGPRMGGVWSYGTKRFQNIEFRYRTGPGVTPSKVPKDTQNLVLSLNVRDFTKIDTAKAWLDALAGFPQLKNVAVLLLGNEQCDNEWIKSYLAANNGRVKFVFVVYDSPDVDNNIFYQWPLGVATYRNFPKVKSAFIPTSIQRKHMCNYMGTIYVNSSRQVLLDLLSTPEMKDRCYVKVRHEWLPEETEHSRDNYLKVLAHSDLTLNPVGMNPECYRIYEALSYGSIPVIENVLTPGNCGNSSGFSVSAPHRLLKSEKAPVIFIKDWQKELPTILDKEAKMTLEQKSKRRKDVLLWYENFKAKMRKRFVSVIQEKFFGVHQFI